MFPVAAKAECGDASQIRPIITISNGAHPDLITFPIYEYSPCFIEVGPSILFGATEMLLDRGFGRLPQHLDIAHSVSGRPLEHLSDETLRLRWWSMAGSLRKAVVWWLTEMGR